MFRVICAAILFLSILLAGCGGGGGGTTNPPDNPNPSGISISVTPHAVAVRTNEQCIFTATVTGTNNKSVVWSVDEEMDGGMVTQNGVYIAPSSEVSYRHVRATSVADPTKFAIALVNVSGIGVDPVGHNGIEVSVSPHEVFLPPNTTMQFTATVVGHSNTAVTWTIVEPNSGTITQDGWYTSPNRDATVHVKATSQADPSKSDIATVVVIPGLPPFPVPM